MGLPRFAVVKHGRRFQVRKGGLPPSRVGCTWKKIQGKEGGLAPATSIRDIFQAVARKWSNRNLPGALHFLTGNIAHRLPVFKQEACCLAFLEVCSKLREEWPFKLVAYVLMPDHIHLIVNPKDGRIRELAGSLKSLAARRIIAGAKDMSFLKEKPDPDGSIHQVWQDSFRAIPLWSAWLIWQKINYIHNNPIKAGLVRSAGDYRWSSFRSFYFGECEPIEVDKDWWWEGDVQKLARASAEWTAEMAREKNAK